MGFMMNVILINMVDLTNCQEYQVLVIGFSNIVETVNECESRDTKLKSLMKFWRMRKI